MIANISVLLLIIVVLRNVISAVLHFSLVIKLPKRVQIIVKEDCMALLTLSHILTCLGNNGVMGGSADSKHFQTQALFTRESFYTHFSVMCLGCVSGDV